MTEAPAVADYDDAAVARIHAFVEEVTGGKIVRMERQVRWRPAWFADVEKDGELIRLHLRGDRAGDVAIFPDLKREADVIRVLYEHGIPVPKIHGYLADPPCIVMDSVPGTRDLGDAPDNATRAAIGRTYMEAVAAMHKLPLEPFEAIGVHKPEGAKDIALVGLRAYLPHYRRTKSKPEPLLEFVIQWLGRNVPSHRDRASFIQFDSGQFLIEDGKMTGLYDFEFSMIGDPMVDIATMGMRDSIEPLGSPLADLCRHYAEVTGEPIDHDAILFHTLQFATLGTMQFAGTVGDPRDGDPHSVYLEWDLSLRWTILLALSKLSGLPLPEQPPLSPRTGENAVLISKLLDTVERIRGAEPIDEQQKGQATDLIELLARADSLGGEAMQRNLSDVSAYLGRSFSDWSTAEEALEAHILSAGPEEDAALIAIVAAIEQRRLQVWAGTRVGRFAEAVTLLPTR